MLKVDPKTGNLAILLNFDVTEKKMIVGFVISDPKLIKFPSFRQKIFLVLTIVFDPPF